MTLNFKQLLAAVLANSCFVSSALGDPYRIWSEQVMKATKGLEVCASTYWDAVGGRNESEWKKFLPDATYTCKVMKATFNSTMLAARTNVNGMDDILKSYHLAGMAAFDRMAPRYGQNPLEYYVKSLETVKIMYEQHLKIAELNGGW